MRTPQRHLSVDELSHRASTGLAIRRGDIKISEPIPSSYVHNGAEMDGAYEQPTPRIDHSATFSGRVGQGALHGRSGSTPLLSQSVHTSKFTERTSLGPSLSVSNMSASPAKDLAFQRKESGLRASLKRMFSKKSSSATIQKRNTHHSDLIRSPQINIPDTATPHFSPSIHRGVPTPGRPLNSHATYPTLDADSAGDRVQLVDSRQSKKRRDTVPDLSMEPMLSPAELRQCYFSATRERPATPKPDALSRRDAPQVQLLKRRSKSADALAGLLRSPAHAASDRRDRSEEIAYWRNSVVIDPLPQMPAIESTTSVNSIRSGAVSRHPRSEKQRPSIEPAQDFDFGLDDSSHPMRPSTLQERVNTLEVKLFDFEYALAKLQGNDLEKPNIPKKRSRQKPVHDHYPDSGDSSSSSHGISLLSSSREVWQSSSPPPALSPNRVDRTSKATTVKAMHGRRRSGRSHHSNTSIHITHSQYDALRTLIEHEKNARQLLEVQVISLQHQVDSSKTPVRSYNDYPTPSPDSCHNTRVSSSVPVRPPTKQFQKNNNETSRFSMSETEPETELDIEDSKPSGDRSPDLFKTPEETVFRFEPRTISPSGMF